MRTVWLVLLIGFGLQALAQTTEEWSSKGYELYKRGEYQGALESYKQALAASKTQFGPESLPTAATYTWLGVLHLLLNQYPQSLENYQQARQIYEKLLGPKHAISGQAYMNIGDAYGAMDDYPKALEYYGLARGSFDQALGPDNPSTALLLTKTSFLYSRVTDYPKALADALEAVRIYEKTLGAEALETAAAYEQVAYVYQYTSAPAKEVEYLSKALAIKQKNPAVQPFSLGDGWRNLGRAYERLGDLPKALEYVLQAQQIYEATYGPNHPYTALLYQDVSKVYEAMRDYPKAQEKLEKALAIFSGAFGPQSVPVITLYFQLASLYQLAQQYPKAIEVLEKSLSANLKVYGPSNISTAISYGGLGSNYSLMKEYGKSLEHYQKGLELFFPLQAVAFQVLDNQGKAQFKSQYQGLVFGVLKATSSLEQASLEQRRLALDDWLSFKGSAFVFENGIALLLQQADPELKARLEGYLSLRQELASLYTRTPETQAQAAIIQAEIAKRAEQLTTLERELSRQIQAFDKLLSLQRIRWADLAGRLRPDELYIDYAWSDRTPKNLYALTLDAQGSVNLYPLGETPQVAQQIAALRSSLEVGKPLAELAPQSQALYQTLIKPLENSLGQARTLVISPDGPLAFLPFELLSDGQKLLLERFVVRYSPSGRDLIRPGALPASTNPAAVFGNPSFGSQAPAGSRAVASKSLADLLRRTNFSPLPGTEQEARQVAALLGGQTQVFVGDAANELNLFKLNSPRVLHLATHGFFISDPSISNPLLRVGIALAGARASVVSGESYGVLTALQLSSLKLSGTQLVVLSACETGLGDAVAGEGVAGLNQAFLTAGARQVMLSLWKVPDQETAQLMEGFYRRWTGGTTEAQALREAKLELMKQGLPPLFWAAFLLNG